RASLYGARDLEPRAIAGGGGRTLRDRGWLSCHSVDGKGGKAAADVATSNVVGTPGGLIAGMWNHGALMEASAQKQGVSWPALQGRDLADIAAYLGSLRPRPSAPAWKSK